MSENFRGHDPEAGLLQRARTWRDVLPPLVMLNSLRIAGSPIFVGIWLVVATVHAALLSHRLVVLPDRHPSSLWEAVTHSGALPQQVSFMQIGLMLLALLVALIPIALTMRAGALYAAGREGESFVAGAKLVLSRLSTLLLVTLLPIVCSIGLLVPLIVNALCERIPGVGMALSEFVAFVMVPFTLLFGLIAAGSMIAIPLGWASVAIEKRNDAFDALSRGYEYLYRRPVQCFIGLAINLLLAFLVSGIAYAVAVAGFFGCSIVYQVVSREPELPVVLQIAFGNLPLAAGLAAWFANLGALYLLLRQYANQQEIEDIVVSEFDRRGQGLPKFKSK